MKQSFANGRVFPREIFHEQQVRFRSKNKLLRMAFSFFVDWWKGKGVILKFRKVKKKNIDRGSFKNNCFQNVHKKSRNFLPLKQ